MDLNYSNETIWKKSLESRQKSERSIRVMSISVGHREANCQAVLKNSEPCINVDNPNTIYKKKVAFPFNYFI